MLFNGARDSVLDEYLNLDTFPFSEWPFPSNGAFSSLTLKKKGLVKIRFSLPISWHIYDISTHSITYTNMCRTLLSLQQKHFSNLQQRFAMRKMKLTAKQVKY